MNVLVCKYKETHARDVVDNVSYNAKKIIARINMQCENENMLS